MTIKDDQPDGALRIEVILNPPTGKFGLRIIDEGPRVLTRARSRTSWLTPCATSRPNA